MMVPGGLGQTALVPSPSCGMTDLADAYEIPEAARRALACGEGWEGRWEAGWRRDGAVSCGRVSDLGEVLAGGCRPWRHFTWRAGQRHRPGLQFLVSTGRHHGFESLEEQRFLLALDFCGVNDVMPQPFRLRAETTAGWREHIPDFLAVTGSGVLLVDVRPRELVRDDDLVLFAAAAEAALAAGWRYAVVCGWRPHVAEPPICSAWPAWSGRTPIFRWERQMRRSWRSQSAWGQPGSQRWITATSGRCAPRTVRPSNCCPRNGIGSRPPRWSYLTRRRRTSTPNRKRRYSKR
jgi:hypothetical protein